MALEYKAARLPFEIKERVSTDGGGWEVAGYASTFGGDPDAMGDVVVPGAFAESIAQRPTKFLYEHQTPIGYQLEIREDEKGLFGRWAIIDTMAGTDAYKLMKGGVLDSLSIGYIPEEVVVREDGVRLLMKCLVLEVSGVAIPANANAVITDVKDLKKAIGSHQTAVSSSGWDGAADEKRLKAGQSAAYYRRAYAWADPEGDPTTKAAYRFIHHEVDADGNVGAANLRAASAGIGVLNGGRGGTTIPDADRAGVYRHLAAHLKSGDREPPPLKSLAEIERDGPDVIEPPLNLSLELRRRRLARLGVQIGATP